MNSVFSQIGQLTRSLINRRSLTVLSIAFVLIALPLTVYLGQQRQDIRQRASSGAVCTQAEFNDLASADQPAVYCLSTNPNCVVRGVPAEAGGQNFEGSRAITRAEAVAFIARYHVNVIPPGAPGHWEWTTTGAQAFPDVPVTAKDSNGRYTNPYLEIQTAYENGFVKGNGNEFQLNIPWIYGMYGVERSDYFNSAGNPIHATENWTRSRFIQELYNIGNGKAQLTSCIPVEKTRCSANSKCTIAKFQSNDGGTHPLPDYPITYTPDMKACPPATAADMADAGCQTAVNAGSGTITATNCTYASGGTCTLTWSTTGITTGLTTYIESGNGAASVPAGAIQLIATGASGSKEVTGIGTSKQFRLRVGLDTTYNTTFNQNTDRIVNKVDATSPAPPAQTPVTVTAAPATTYTISGTVTGAPAGTTVSAGTGAGSPIKTTQTNTNGFYSFSNISAGYYTIYVSPPAGYSQTSSTFTYGVTVGTSCTIIQTSNTASCVSGNATNVNFTISQTPTQTLTAPANLRPSGSITEGQVTVQWDAVAGATSYEYSLDDTTLNTTIAGCNTKSGTTNGGKCVLTFPANQQSYNFLAGHTYRIGVSAISTSASGAITRGPESSVTITATATVSQAPSTAPTAVITPVPNATELVVSFTQHGIGLAADNANPNPTPLTISGTIQPFPTPVSPFFTRSVTVYLSTGKTVIDGVPVYEYQKSGTVQFGGTSNAYYKGVVNLGTDIPAGQYIVSVRTSNSISQQATGFVTIVPAKSVNVGFPPLISGNVYDSAIDNTSPKNDNQLDILDYNAIMDNWLIEDICNGKSGTELEVCQTIRTRADLNADGIVDVLDYNLLIREMSVQRGR